MRTLIFLLATAIFCGPAPGFSAIFRPAPEVLNAQLDINKNNQLDPEEVLLGLKHELLGQAYNLSAMRELGEIPKVLRLELEKEFSARGPQNSPSKLRRRYDDLLRLYPDRKPPYQLDGMDPAVFGLRGRAKLGPSDAEIAAKKMLSRWSVQIRRSKEDLDKPMDKDFDPYAQGALLSFGRNFETKTDMWTLKGVTALNYNVWLNPDYDPRVARAADGQFVEPESTLLQWRSFGARLLTTLDRVDASNGGSGEVNSLRWDLGIKAEAGLRDSVALIDSFTLTLDATYATDFDFDKKVIGGQFEIYPIFALWGCGSYGDLWRYRNRFGKEASALFVRWTPWVHVEAGTVEEAGSSAELRNYDSFARAGGGILLEVMPFADFFEKRLSLQARYLHYEGLMSDVRSSHFFRASLQYVLPIGSGVYEAAAAEGVEGEAKELRERNALVTFRVEYANGELPFSQEQEETLLCGIGIAF